MEEVVELQNNFGITESFVLEGTSRDHLVQPACSSRVI